MAELGARFERFRQEHARGTRVPGELRAAVLAALDKGVAPGDLYRACGVCWSQVVAWKAADRAAPVTPQYGEAANVRVFSVVDDQPVRSPEPTESVGQELELRLGAWSVSVRLADRARVERG